MSGQVEEQVQWERGGSYNTILVGDRRFAEKYAYKVSKCVGRKVKAYINRSKNIWTVTISNSELFKLFCDIRANPDKIRDLVTEGQLNRTNMLEFIEGLFDAEGCVKIIREKVRRVPKICLDTTNTNKKYLDIMQDFIKQSLDIDSHYSIQKANALTHRQQTYHLRIYKKDSVRKFLLYISTTKLTEEKIPLVSNWFEV